MDKNQEAYARLIGILYTDGCVSPKGRNSWRIVVSNNSPAVIDYFEESISVCFEKPIRRFEKGKLHVGILDSKEVGQSLIKRHGTLRTESCHSHQQCPFLRGGRKPCLECQPVEFRGVIYPPAKLSPFVTVAEIRVFLQAAFSCDGGVNLYVARRGKAKWLIRNVYLACKHPNLIQQYSELLTEIGIRNRMLENDWRVLVQGQCNLQKFADQVGFLSGILVGANSKFWQGQEKANVLQMLLDSYGNPRSILDHPAFEKSDQRVMI